MLIQIIILITTRNICRNLLLDMPDSFGLATWRWRLSQQNRAQIMAFGALKQAHRQILLHASKVILTIVDSEAYLPRNALDLLPRLELVVDGLQVPVADDRQLGRPVLLVESSDLFLEVGDLVGGVLGRAHELDDVEVQGALLLVQVVVQVIVDEVLRCVLLRL